MGSLSNYGENKVLDAYFGQSPAPPSTFHFAAFTVMPDEAGAGGVEPSGNGYERAAFGNNSTNFPAASGSQKANAVAILWPAATGSWGTILGIGIYDAATDGNLIGFALLSESIAIGSGERLVLDEGALTIVLE
jgi:hypothetical protein